MSQKPVRKEVGPKGPFPVVKRVNEPQKTKILQNIWKYICFENVCFIGFVAVRLPDRTLLPGISSWH